MDVKGEWLIAAAVLIPVSLGVAGCPKKTTTPVGTESSRPIGDMAPVDTPAATDNSLPPPEPTTAAPTAPTGGGRVYIVQKGEGLMAVARKVYNDEHQWKKIATANNLQPPYPLKVGQKLVIP